MSKWKSEIMFNVRYIISGVLNGIIGLGTIWYLTHVGIMPIIANLIGFSVSIAFAFLISKKFVFKSEGRFTSEAIKYFSSFGISYLINIIVLQLCVSIFLLSPLLSQGIAVTAYVISMYFASRIYIFRGN